MTRHSKNVTALGISTYNEQQKLNKEYNKNKLTKLTAEQQYTTDICNICTNIAHNPLICKQGHIYCKSCIYESLLKQKQIIKNNKNILNNTVNTDDDSDKAAIELYEQTNQLLDDTTVNNNKKRKSIDNNNNELSSYWIPSKVYKHTKNVNINNDNSNKMLTATMCYSYNHTLKLKELYNVIFTVQNNINDKIYKLQQQDNNNNVDNINDILTQYNYNERYKCSSCSELINYNTHMYVINICGHTICKSCVDIIKNELQCSVCTVSLNNVNDIILIQCGNTANNSTTTKASNTANSTDIAKVNR